MLPKNMSHSNVQMQTCLLSTSAVLNATTLGRSPELTSQQMLVLLKLFISLHSSAVLEKDIFPLIKTSPLESQMEVFCLWT